MVKAKCQLHGCEFTVEDGEHIDDVVIQMREHWRAQHPTKYFSAHNCAKAAQSFNMTWDEVMVNHYGPQWEQAGIEIANDRYTINDILNSRNYNDEIKERAREMMVALDERRRQEREAGANNPPAVPDNRAGRRRLRGAAMRGVGAPQEAQAFPAPRDGIVEFNPQEFDVLPPLPAFEEEMEEGDIDF